MKLKSNGSIASTNTKQAEHLQDRSKLSNYSEMDVSSPFADLKQISVQNKPLGGKVNYFYFHFISFYFLFIFLLF
jgi:hypothetical protein